MSAAGAIGPPRRIDDAGASAAHAWRPRLAVSGEIVFAVWEDSRTGRAELRIAATELSALSP